MSDIKCGNCKYRLPKDFCGNLQSLYYNKKINLGDHCEFFVENPTEEHFKKGTLKYLEALELNFSGSGTNNEIINLFNNAADELKIALSTGLAEADVIEANASLGDCYIWIANIKFGDKYALSEECLKGASYIEQAFKLDKKGNYGVFNQPDHTIFLKTLDGIYYYNEIEIEEKKGNEAAIEFANEKFELSSYLPEPPFLYLLLQIGNIYARMGHYYDAVKTYESIINSKFWDANESLKPEYDQIKITAQQNLNICKRKI